VAWAKTVVCLAAMAATALQVMIAPAAPK